MIAKKYTNSFKNINNNGYHMVLINNKPSFDDFIKIK